MNTEFSGESESSGYDEKEAEQELLELERYISDIWKFLPMPVAYASPLLVILDVDDAALRILGYTKEELVGSDLADIFFSKDEAEKIIDRTRGSGELNNIEVSLVDKKGNRIPVNISTMVRKDENGEVIGYFLSFLDITERKLSEREIEQKMIELEEFHDLAVGRELKMIELEKEIEDLKSKIQEEPTSS